MANCCSPESYGEFFTRRMARRSAKQYRKRGLDSTSAAIVRRIGDVRGATVLEVGGGVGAIGLELLKAGAERVTTVELSPAYDQEALALAREHGVADRVERRVGDFVADETPEADVVVLNRVVCCYPDYDALLGAAADHAQRVLAFTFPRERSWIRLGFGVVNLVSRVRRSAFRTYVHPGAALVAVPRARGLQLDVDRAGALWRLTVFRRATQPA